MKKKKIVIVFGTRPEIIRFAPVIRELEKINKVKIILLYTGQHYSDNLSQVFFDEFKIKPSNINLGVGEMSPVAQLGEIIKRAGRALLPVQPDVVCVWGDTNSSLGVSLAANKLSLKLAHIEAGCRSFDFRMAEEYNRIVIDHISNFLFPVSTNDKNNLIREKVGGEIFSVGDPLFDIFKDNVKRLKARKEKKFPNLTQKYALLTLHRAENVDSRSILKRILKELIRVRSHKIVFPIHPRTKKMIKKFGLTGLLKGKNIILMSPVGYLEILELILGSDLIITDSGGIQKEAFFARKPCLTLRKSTEWKDTVKLGANILLNPEESKDMDKLVFLVKDIDQVKRQLHMIKDKPYGQGNSSKEIAKILIKLAS